MASCHLGSFCVFVLSLCLSCESLSCPLCLFALFIPSLSHICFPVCVSLTCFLVPPQPFVFAYSHPSVSVRVCVTSRFILLSLSHVHCVQFCFPCHVMPDLSLRCSHASRFSMHVSSCVYIVSVPLCPLPDRLFVSILHALSALV